MTPQGEVIRTRDGQPVPELAAWLTGKRTAGRLAEQGVIVPAGHLVELGRAVIEHEPAPDRDPALAELLAQLQHRNQVERLALETSPERLNGMVSEANGLPEKRALRDVQADSREREVDRTPGRDTNPIKEQLDYELSRL